MANLKILLADDHAVVREGLKRLIETAPDMDVVAEAEDGEEAIAKTAANLPDVVVMDVSMRPVGGAQATRELRRRCPAASVLASRPTAPLSVLIRVAAKVSAIAIIGLPVSRASNAVPEPRSGG